MTESIWSALSIGILFGVTSGSSPGPLLFLVISETLRHGIRAGVIVAVTPLFTDFPVMAAAVLILNHLAHFDFFLSVISFGGAVFLIRIGWISFKTIDFYTEKENMKPHSLCTRMITNYLNPSMYLFWFTVGAPFIILSGDLLNVTSLIFMLSFYVSIIGVKMIFAIITGYSRCFLQDLWYHRLTKLLGLCLIGYSSILIIEGLNYFRAA